MAPAAEQIKTCGSNMSVLCQQTEILLRWLTWKVLDSQGLRIKKRKLVFRISIAHHIRGNTFSDQEIEIKFTTDWVSNYARVKPFQLKRTWKRLPSPAAIRESAWAGDSTTSSLIPSIKAPYNQHKEMFSAESRL